MQTLKILALGTLFSVGGILLCVLDAIFTRGGLSMPAGSSHAAAVGLTAILGGLIGAMVSDPICWLVIPLAFGLAFWFVRSRQKPKPA
jgi:hypothetical protein